MTTARHAQNSSLEECIGPAFYYKQLWLTYTYRLRCCYMDPLAHVCYHDDIMILTCLNRLKMFLISLTFRSKFKYAFS